MKFGKSVSGLLREALNAHECNVITYICIRICVWMKHFIVGIVVRQ